MSARHNWDREQLAEILLGRKTVHPNEGLLLNGQWTECWLWPSTGKPPYGMIKVCGRGWSVHRISIWVFKMDSRARMTGRKYHARHRCSNPNCLRPEHLLMGTGRANHIDYLRTRKVRELCIHGHRLTKANRYRQKGTYRNYCRECQRLKQARRVARFKSRGLSSTGKPYKTPEGKARWL